jgi:hypothetical protein
VKRARKRKPLHPPKVRNPVARSPLLAKGGVHGPTTRARRRAANVAAAKVANDPESYD